MCRNLTLVRDTPSYNVLFFYEVCKFASVVLELLLRHDFDLIVPLTLGVGMYLLHGTHSLIMF